MFSQNSNSRIGNSVAATQSLIIRAEPTNEALRFSSVQSARSFVVFDWIDIPHIDSWWIEPVVATTARQREHR
jgi:hypothetical protein